MRYLLTALLALPFLTACLGSDPSVVAVLVADASAGTGAALDADEFEAAIEEVCDGCKVEVHDAGGDADTQREQFRAALDAGVGAVVVEAVEPEVAEEFAAAERDQPLVAAGVFVPGADWFVGVTTPVAGSGFASDLEAARALVAGKEKSFSHVPTAAISAQSATVAAHAMARAELTAPGEYEGVPSWTYEPVEVTLANLTTVLVGPGLLDVEDICVEDAERCARLGLL